MSLSLGIAIYLTIWWVVLFAVLPIGVRSQHEEKEYLLGTDPGAPVAPKLLMKAIITTVVTSVLFAGLWWFMRSQQF
jgi:predicted secreted protein